MARDYLELARQYNFVQDSPSLGTEVDQSSESVWGSWECHSASSAASIHEAPTLRLTSGDEVENLILAAELLALEREKLGKKSLTSAIHNKIPDQHKETINEPVKKYYLEKPLEKHNFIETEENKLAYYSITAPITLDTPRTFIEEKETENSLHLLTPKQKQDPRESPLDVQSPVGENEETTDTEKMNYGENRNYTENMSHGEKINYSEKINHCERMSYSEVPRLSLESLGRDASEERNRFSKDVKEVCNSSIREFASDVSEEDCGMGVRDGNDVRSLAPRRATTPHHYTSSQYHATPHHAMPHHHTTSNQHAMSQHHATPHHRASSRVGVDAGLAGSVQQGCSQLLQLALTATSTLARMNRLLRQTAQHESAGEVLRDVEESEAQHTTLEAQLSKAASHLQGSVSQIQGVEGRLAEVEGEVDRVDGCVVELLGVVEEGLSSIGLNHMLGVTSPRRRGPLRTLEDVTSGVTLVLGELRRRSGRVVTLEEEVRRYAGELEELRDAVMQKEARVRAGEGELARLREHSDRDYTQLKQCLAQAEETITETHAERMRLTEQSRRQNADHESVRTSLQQKLADTQRTLEARISELEGGLQRAVRERQAGEAATAELRTQLALKLDQIKMMEDEHGLVVGGLRTSLKQQTSDADAARTQVATITAERNAMANKMKNMENELSEEQERRGEAQREAAGLRTELSAIKAEHADAERSLQDKVDDLNATRCELERQVRAGDFKVLQLRTEVEMERARTITLKEENDNYAKKVQSLQERIWGLTRRRRHVSDDGYKSAHEDHHGNNTYRKEYVGSEYGNATYRKECSADCAGANVSSLHHVQALVRDVGAGQQREEQLHGLLQEKDAAIRNMQDNMARQINDKNQELEDLTGKVSVLEEQLGSLLSGLEVSAAIGDVTTEVGRLLQRRAHHLDAMDNTSRNLHTELASVTRENQMLRAELGASRRGSQEVSHEAHGVARKAREEARQERLNATRFQEQCLKLQAQLEAVQTSLEQERQEKKLREAVHTAKHREFGILIGSAATSLQSSLSIEKE